MLPVLECTSEGVERVPNLDARAGSVMLADELWRRLGLPGEPEPDEAGRLAEHDKLCKQLADNRAAGNNVDSASPQMRELLRDFFRRYSAQSWLVVATKWLQLGETVPGSATGRGVGALDGRRYETDILEASLYVWSRDGDVVFRADLSCRGQNKGEEHDCGPRFEKIPARVGEMVDGFPLPIIAKAVIIRVTPDLPSRREPDATLDFVPPRPIEPYTPPNELVDEDGRPPVGEADQAPAVRRHKGGRAHLGKARHRRGGKKIKRPRRSR